MTMDSRLQGWLDDPVTRRQVLRGALSGGAVIAAGGFLGACGGDDGGGDGGGGSGAPASGAAANQKLRMGGTLRVGATGGGATDTIDAHKPVVDTGHHACLEHVRVAGGPHAGLLGAPDAPRGVDRARPDDQDVGHPAQARPHIPQRQAGHRRRRHLLPPAHHRPEGPEGRRRVDRLRRHQGPQEDGRPHGARPAAVRQLGLPGRHRPVLQLDRPDGLRPAEPRRHRPVQVRARSPPASRARSPSSPTTGRRASRTSTSWSSSTSPRTPRASTRCWAARSTRSTTCRPRRSRASRPTRGSAC